MSTALIRCLLAVLALSDNLETVASKDVAQLLGVKRPTVHRALALLQEKGLVQKALYSDVHLTPAGETLARELEAQRDGLFLLFLRRYGLSHEESLQAAFLLMHGLKKESLEKLLAQEE